VTRELDQKLSSPQLMVTPKGNWGDGVTEGWENFDVSTSRLQPLTIDRAGIILDRQRQEHYVPEEERGFRSCHLP